MNIFAVAYHAFMILVDKDKLSYSDKDRIIAPFYEIELDTGIIISTLILPRKESVALLTKHHISSATHAGVKTMLGMHFVS